MWQDILSVAELNTLISDPLAGIGDFNLILKHSNRCSVSSMAKNRIEKNRDERITYYIINVIANRDVSDALADLTGIRHESPQAFLFNGPSLVEAKSHSAIRPSEISELVDSLIQTQT